MELPGKNDIEEAYSLIREQVHQTPVLHSRLVNEYCGAELVFKCENFQKVGAFKFRGASNAVAHLSREELNRGVATHSSGNHAAALALAAKTQGAKAYIVMPESAPDIKKKAVEGYGASITFCKPTLQAREETLEHVVDQTGATFVHPYDNFYVVSGQGTAALELLRSYPEPDVLMAPVGGGGLLSGTATWVKTTHPGIQVIAAEPAGADDAWKSFTAGKLIPSVNPQTIADGLLTSLSNLTFTIIREKVDDIIRVQEESIIKAMRLIWERMKILIEPSSAVPMAAVLENPERFAGKKIAIILSGGNVDLGKLPF